LEKDWNESNMHLEGEREESGLHEYTEDRTGPHRYYDTHVYTYFFLWVATLREISDARKGVEEKKEEPIGKTNAVRVFIVIWCKMTTRDVYTM
jgi:hypothetical protein